MIETRVHEALEFLLNREKISIDLGLSSCTLMEEDKQGKSMLALNIQTKDSILVSNFDKVPKLDVLKWNIICQSNQLHSGKCVDHFILAKNADDDWTLHMFEMKTTVGNKTWIDIKYKIRASYFSIKVFITLLGINVRDENILIYTTYANENFTRTTPPLGKRVTDFKKDEWDKDCISVPLIFSSGENVFNYKTPIKFRHRKIEMHLSDDGYLKNNQPVNI